MTRKEMYEEAVRICKAAERADRHFWTRGTVDLALWVDAYTLDAWCREATVGKIVAKVGGFNVITIRTDCEALNWSKIRVPATLIVALWNEQELYDKTLREKRQKSLSGTPAQKRLRGETESPKKPEDTKTEQASSLVEMWQICCPDCGDVWRLKSRPSLKPSTLDCSCGALIEYSVS